MICLMIQKFGGGYPFLKMSKYLLYDELFSSTKCRHRTLYIFLYTQKNSMNKKHPKNPTFKHTTNPSANSWGQNNKIQLRTQMVFTFLEFSLTQNQKETTESTQTVGETCSSSTFCTENRDSITSPMLRPRCYGTITTSTAKAKRGSPTAASRGPWWFGGSFRSFYPIFLGGNFEKRGKGFFQVIFQVLTNIHDFRFIIICWCNKWILKTKPFGIFGI